MSESVGARITWESFEKHQREIAAEQQIGADYIASLRQRLARIEAILGPKLDAELKWLEATKHNSSSISMTPAEARELQALLTRASPAPAEGES